MSGCEFIKGRRGRFLAFLLIITFIRECRWAGFPPHPVGWLLLREEPECRWCQGHSISLPHAAARDVLARAGWSWPRAPAEKGRGVSGAAGAAEQGRLPPAAWKGGHVRRFFWLLNDLYLSSLLKIKFKICIQRWRLTCFLYEFLWITIDFWMWFLKSYFWGSGDFPAAIIMYCHS